MFQFRPRQELDVVLADARIRLLKARSLKLRAIASCGEGKPLPLHRVQPRFPRLHEFVRQLELVRRAEREGYALNAATHLEAALQDLLEQVDTRNPIVLWRRAAALRDFLNARI